MAADLFGITTYETEGRAVIELHGELDLHGSEVVVATAQDVLARRPDAIEIDAAELRFIDSSGLKALCVAQQAAAAVDVPLTVVDASAEVERTFEMTGLGAALRGEARGAR